MSKPIPKRLISEWAEVRQAKELQIDAVRGFLLWAANKGFNLVKEEERGNQANE